MHPVPTVAVQSLGAIGSLTGVPGVQAVLATVGLILDATNVAKSNRLAWVRTAELVNEILEVIHAELWNVTAQLSPRIVEALAQLNQKLQHVHQFVKQQANTGFVKRILLSSTGTSDQRARDEVAMALAKFRLECQIHLRQSLHDIEKICARRRQSVLATLERLTLQTSGTATAPQDELQSRPVPTVQLLIGRDLELRIIVDQIKSNSNSTTPGHIDILGGGGMGKSTLALAVLHHPEVVAVFEGHRYFVSCESVESPGGLIAEIASQMGIVGDELRKRLFATLRKRRLAIVLDNFETPWEDVHRRIEIEQVLGALSALQNITLLITMRGSERPMGTTWTTPLLEPIQPLNLTAARHIFSSIASLTSKQEESHETLEFLSLLDGVPLAIALAARMATTQSIPSLLAQWKDEGTAALQVSNHPGRHSSLDLSIKMSIEASRVARIPQATELLQLLALLPSGIPEEFIHSAFLNIRRSASALKNSLLVYTDDVGRLRSLSPIRFYMLKRHSPPYALIKPLEQHYIDLAKLISKLGTSHTKPLLVQLIAEWPNVESICTHCLDNREHATWSVPVISSFDRLLVHVGLPKTRLLDRSLARPNLSDHERLQLILAKMLRGTSRQEEIALGRHAVELAQAVDDLALGAEARLRLGHALQGTDHAAADRYVFEVLAVYQELGDAYLADQGMCWSRLAHGAFFSDQYAECLERARLATACFKAADFPKGITTLDGWVAHVHLRQGHIDRAAEVAANALRICLQLDATAQLPVIYECLGGIALVRGDFEEGIRMHEMCRALHKKGDRTPKVAYQTESICAPLIWMGDITAARVAFEEARALQPQFSANQQLMHIVREVLLCRAEGKTELATIRAYDALKMTREQRATRVEVQVRGLLGDIALETASRAPKNARLTLELAHEALNQFILNTAICSKITNVIYLVISIGGIGRALLGCQEYDTARGVLSWAVVWTRKLGMKAEYAQSLVALARMELAVGSPEGVVVRAWTIAREAAVAVRMGQLVAECDSRLRR